MTLLQRIRFCTLTLHVDSGSPQFRTGAWQKRAQITYWRLPVEGVEVNDEVLTFAKHAVVSSDAFFNAFHLAHWSKLTTVRSLALRLSFTGKFRIEILGHTRLGQEELLSQSEAGDCGETESSFDIPLENLPHVLRLSFRLTAREDGSRLLGGAWTTTDVPAHPIRLGIGITTFDRPKSVARLVSHLTSDPALGAENVSIRVIDQGGGAELGTPEDDRVRIVAQRNLGASGGFARALQELLETPSCTHVLLLEDDVELEPDSVLRAMRMAQYAKSPFLLGGTQLDLFYPSFALNGGENWARDARGFYGDFFESKNNIQQIDYAQANYTDILSVPSPSDYAAWRFCLIPLEVVRKVGLPLQLFHRCIDIEYGLRAKAKGFSSWVVPGIGIWHWILQAKPDPWVGYVEAYNRLLLNALQGPSEALDMFRALSTATLEQLSIFKYQNAAAILQALEDFLAGAEAFDKRIVPDHFIQLRTNISLFTANEKGMPQVCPDQGEALRARLFALIERCQREGDRSQNSLKDYLPRTTSLDAWRYYLAHGKFAGAAQGASLNG